MDTTGIIRQLKEDDLWTYEVDLGHEDLVQRESDKGLLIPYGGEQGILYWWPKSRLRRSHGGHLYTQAWLVEKKTGTRYEYP